jgi:NTE family protein
VIQEIERRGLRFDLIVGTSMGAIIGCLYACYEDSAKVIEHLKYCFESELFVKAASNVIDENPAFLNSDGFFNRFVWLFRKGVFYTHTMLRMELVTEELYDRLFAMLIPDLLIEDLPVRFAAVAMDLMTGEEVVLTKGSLRRAVAASSAIPGMFPVIEINGRSLVDGGWTDNVPAAPAVALGAHFVLAVDATLEVPGMAPSPRSAMEILLRCNEITRILLTRHRKSAADILIAPEIANIFWADFSALDQCLFAGRKALEESASAIYKQMPLRRLLTFQGAIHPARIGAWRHPFLIL